ncbi:MAG: hypothetical protein M3O34_07950 [Chloroflexota bacterium]|nr:hypothetical protein [Chloroflexota bacterium]
MKEDRAAARRPSAQPVELSPGAEGRARSVPRPSLTSQDMRRLTLYKWRYALESAGFTAEQARRLMFLRWLHARRGVGH